MTILIIENNPGLRRVIRKFVSQSDHDVWECNDASEALQQGGQPQPEWILFNLNIADPDAVEIIATLKATWTSTKVVALTTYDEVELRKAALGAGAHAYVLKDDLAQLRTLLQQKY